MMLIVMGIGVGTEISYVYGYVDIRNGNGYSITISAYSAWRILGGAE